MALDVLITAAERSVHETWAASNFDIAAFPAIAEQSLRTLLGHGVVGQTELLGWIAGSPALPYQPRLDQTFGQPPVTLAWNGAFQIDALFWSAAGTAIHGHGFAGAFGVVQDESVHLTFSFEEQQRFADHFRTGTVRRTGLERLTEGAVRRIEPGSHTMHALVHLGRPSISIVIRTCGAWPGAPEMVAFPPSVVLSPSPELPLRTRQIQVLDMLAAVSPHAAGDFANAILANGDIHTAFLALCALGADRAAAMIHAMFGDAAIVLVAAARQDARRRKAEALLRRASDRAARAVLTLILFNQDCGGIRRDAKTIFPDQDWAATVAQGMARLAGFGPDDAADRMIVAALADHIGDLASSGAATPPREDIMGLCDTLGRDLLFQAVFTQADDIEGG